MPQSQGTKHQNKDKGGGSKVGEAFTATVSPAAGVVSSGKSGDFRAGSYNPASVLGTGDNADLKTYSVEAV